MKKIITFILIVTTFSFASSIAEIQFTKFDISTNIKTMVNLLENCEIDTVNFYSAYGKFKFKCDNGYLNVETLSTMYGCIGFKDGSKYCFHDNSERIDDEFHVTVYRHTTKTLNNRLEIYRFMKDKLIYNKNNE